jgi:hypothetical protein
VGYGTHMAVTVRKRGWAHQWRPLDGGEVLQQTLGVVNGRMQLRAGALPLSVQILPTQRAAMTGGRNRVVVIHTAFRKYSHPLTLTHWPTHNPL